MESEKLLITRENPRATSFTSSNKAMSNELAQKPMPSILDRFKALLKQREDELKPAGEAEVPPLTTEEVVHLYEVVLSELTFNSKPIITDLTIIAGELRDHGEGIADAICCRIVEVQVEQKLPSLYLLDSIVKNIGRAYVRHFSSRLPEVFCEAYRQVHPNLYPAMRHLFGTWSTVFPPPVLRKIETQLQFSSPVNQQSSLRASESPRPTHGIHVNPKYLRQLESSTTDNNVSHVRGRSSDLKVCGQNPSIVYDEFDSDHSEGTSSQVGAQRFNLVGGLNRPSFATGADGSPRRFADVASPSNSVFDHGLARVISRENETSEWRKKQYSDNNNNRFEMSAAFNLNNGHDRQGPRALIDAYGSDNSNRSSNNKPLQVERLDVNGMGNKASSKSWQNTEEEEFDWEDMSPTLADGHRTNELLSSSVLRFGNVGSRPGFEKLNASLLKSDIPGNRSGQALLPLVDDSSIIAEDAVVSSSGRGSAGLIPGIQTDSNQILGSRYPQETWNRSHHFSRAPQPFNAGGRGKNLQMPMSAAGVSLSGSDKMASLVDRLPDADAQLIRNPVVASRLGSASLDSNVLGVRPVTASSSTPVWPPVNVHNSRPLPVPSIYALQKQAGSQFELINPGTMLNQGQNKSLYMPEQQFDGLPNKDLNLAKVPPLPNHLAALNQRNQLQLNSLQSQFLPSHEFREIFRPFVASQIPPQIRAPSLNHGYTPQGQSAVLSAVPSNQVSAILTPLQFQNIPISMHFGVALPPLPRGPPPSQMIPGSQNAGLPVPNQPGSAFSGLISSLMAQGFISLTKQPDTQDSVGLEFNLDLLKVRHESAISALYADLPRQCMTCGLRFKCQEEHSVHMDWHVTKNRMSKNRKQKPSRKWFVNTSMWLSGAEALGAEAVPGFLPAETVVEKKDDEELAVPADEDQSACALCGEPFDDFYSDETEEWMYKGAVYMNAPDGSTVGMDRSQLGPIVHAKCRSESTVVPPEDFGHNEGGNTEGSGHRKRLRS